MLGGFAAGCAAPIPARMANPIIPVAAPRSKSRREIGFFPRSPIEPPLIQMKYFYLGVLHLRFIGPAICSRCDPSTSPASVTSGPGPGGRRGG